MLRKPLYIYKRDKSSTFYQKMICTAELLKFIK